MVNAPGEVLWIFSSTSNMVCECWLTEVSHFDVIAGSSLSQGQGQDISPHYLIHEIVTIGMSMPHAHV
jgi:hypothetical protein